MGATGLKTSVKLEQTGAGARLVDSATGRSMPLADSEALLLEFWDGTGDASALAQAASDASLAFEAGQVAVFLSRLSKAGFLAVEVSAGVADEGILPSEVVPRFRLDLQLLRPTTGAGSTQVKDPAVARSFTLFDFELSIARMLDGKRTAAEVIEAASSIGIPVGLGSLRSFIAQLRAYRFLLDEAAQPPSAEQITTWAKRPTWPPQVRALFQRALKLRRGSEPRAALPVVAEILALEPTNAEAMDLKAQIEALGEGGKSEFDFEKLHGARPLAPGAAHGPSIGAEVRRSLRDLDVSLLVTDEPPPEQPASPEEREPDPAVSAPISPEEVDAALSKSQRRRTTTIAAAVLLFGVVGFFVRPVQWRTRVACRLSAMEVARPKSPRAGVVLNVSARSGTEVKEAQALATLDRAGEDQLLLELKAKAEAAEKRVKGFEADPCDPKVRAKAEAKLAAAQKDVATARTDLEAARALSDEAKRTRAVATAEAALRARTKSLARVEVEVEELTLDKALQAAKDEVAAAEKQQEDLKRQMTETSAITSPASGLFLAPENAVGLKLQAGDPFGSIVSKTARVEATGPFSVQLPVPDAKLDLEVVKLSVGNEAWADGPNGRTLTGTIEVRDATLFDKPLELQLDFGQRPFFKELFGSP